MKELIESEKSSKEIVNSLTEQVKPEVHDRIRKAMDNIGSVDWEAEQQHGRTDEVDVVVRADDLSTSDDRKIENEFERVDMNAKKIFGQHPGDGIFIELVVF